jgi:PAS domain S-box-containing protein
VAGQTTIALREADLRGLIESAVDCAIITADPDGLVLAWNSGARRLLGWDEASAPTIDMAAVVSSEARDADIAAALSGTPVSREGWLLRHDGSRVWAGIEAMAIRPDGAREPVGVLWMLRDRSSARRAEAALRESEARHRLLIESWAQAVWETDADGVVVADSPSWRAYTGQPPEEWLGYGWLDAIHPDDRTHAERQWRETVAGRGLVDTEFRLRAPDGGWRWTNVRAAPVIDAAGRVEKWVGMNIDIDHRKRAEEALRESEARLRGVLDGMTEGFGLLAPDFTILEHNSEALRMDGRPRGEIVGHSHWNVYPDSQNTELGHLLAHAMEARVQVSLEHRYSFANGRALWLDMRAYPTADGSLAVFWRDVTDRKAAEAALQEQEQKYRTLFESIDEGFCIIEMLFDEHGQATDYVFRETNPVFEQQAGFRIAPGQRMREIAPDHEQFWFDTYGRIALTGEPARFEHHAGSFGVVYDVYAFRVDAPDLRRVAVLFRDITARKRAEDALRESETRFRGFAENSADVLWMTNHSGSRLDYLSPAFERIFGEVRDRIMADLGRFQDLLHPDDRDAVAGLLPRALAGETALAHYRVVRPSDSRIVHLRDTGFPIRDAAGAVARAAGIVQDITDLHEASAALKAEKERFRTLAEGIPQLVWRAAPDGGWTSASPQWQAYTGQTAEESRGLGWLDALHPDDRDAAHAAWARAQEPGVYEAEFRLHEAGSGAPTWFQARGVPIRDASGSIAEWIGACANIDDQVRARETLARTGEELEARVTERTGKLMAAEESLRQSQKMEAIGQLTGGIAHDFNNMLQGVSGALVMAQRRLAEGRMPDVTRYMQAAGDAATRAAGLTRRLLAFARRQRLDPRPIDADALIAGMGDLLRRTMGPSITVELDLRDGAGQVLCDPSELEGAVLNLCINPRDAMPQGGRLTIATSDLRLTAADIALYEGATAGDYVSIRIEDTGIGMMPEVLERVLEPFFTTKPQGEGTGLGLSQVHGFVRQSGGVLRIASAPGRGTAVQVLLPITPAEALSADRGGTAQAAVQRSRGETVLMVDDEAAVRGPAAEHLRDLGYHVVEANDGPTALRLLDEGLRPDVLVTDVGMPNGMDGCMVTEEAQRRLPGLPVIFVTGYARVALPENAVVVTKPFDLDLLARRLGFVFGRHP